MAAERPSRPNHCIKPAAWLNSTAGTANAANYANGNRNTATLGCSKASCCSGDARPAPLVARCYPAGPGGPRCQTSSAVLLTFPRRTSHPTKPAVIPATMSKFCPAKVISSGTRWAAANPYKVISTDTRTKLVSTERATACAKNASRLLTRAMPAAPAQIAAANYPNGFSKNHSPSPLPASPTTPAPPAIPAPAAPPLGVAPAQAATPLPASLPQTASSGPAGPAGAVR